LAWCREIRELAFVDAIAFCRLLEFFCAAKRSFTIECLPLHDFVHQEN
jgi:hypothetical protein